MAWAEWMEWVLVLLERLHLLLQFRMSFII